MASLAEFMSTLGRLTRPDKAAAWDAVGLQVGDPVATVARVAVCHEITESVTARLVIELPELVVTYHPLLFRPTTRLVASPTPGGRAWRLANAGVAVAVTHTDFDAAPGGTADSLAAALGLEGIAPFGPVAAAEQAKVVVFVPPSNADDVAAAMAAAGGGRIGNYDTCFFRTAGTGTFRPGEETDPAAGRRGTLSVEEEVRLEMPVPVAKVGAVVAALVAAHPYEEPAFDVMAVESNHGFIGRVGAWTGAVGELATLCAERLDGHGTRLAGDPHRRVQRVAVVPGSGSSFTDAARAAGADVLVTGDVDHHRAVAAVDAGLAVIDPGHAATERPGMGRLAAAVRSLDVDVVDMTDGAGPWVRVPPGSLP